jgi:hypothetical protein
MDSFGHREGIPSSNEQGIAFPLTLRAMALAVEYPKHQWAAWVWRVLKVGTQSLIDDFCADVLGIGPGPASV